MKILITAPSLDENKNVSGISTLVREIIEHSNAEFYHFQAGRQDDDKIDIRWILQQILLTPRFLWTIYREKIDLVHINTALVPLSIVRDAALTFTARLANRPVLLHPNGGRFLMEDFTSRPLAWTTEKMFRSAGKVLVLSEHEKASITNRWQNLDVRILPNAIATDEVPNVERDLTNEKTIIFLGRLHESKGLHEIIEACRILKTENFNFQFNCFGAGALKDFFIAKMSQILGENFYYGGVISGAEKWKRLAESDIFLLPSRYGEGLPLAMLEAMAARCVVVVADVASVRAVIKDGENGLMVETYNTAQVVEKLKFLLSGEANWKILQRNARTTIEKDFAITDYVKKLEKIYAEISSHRQKC
ncbi:glycosyltransferase family 4 protein [soil metagenome]|jgi:glycosyltransferase involved in cell wall biosynthesis|nr:glycosyltransferase family 4 protein [Pyrinomonadaceae bacterium]